MSGEHAGSTAALLRDQDGLYQCGLLAQIATESLLICVQAVSIDTDSGADLLNARSDRTILLITESTSAIGRN